MYIGEKNRRLKYKTKQPNLTLVTLHSAILLNNVSSSLTSLYFSIPLKYAGEAKLPLEDASYRIYEDEMILAFMLVHMFCKGNQTKANK